MKNCTAVSYTHLIVKERPEQVHVDIAHHSTAQIDGSGNVIQRIFHEHHIGRFNGNVRSRADGYSDICPGKCRRVVDTITHHGNFVALLLQLADVCQMCIRDRYKVSRK